MSMFEFLTKVKWWRQKNWRNLGTGLQTMTDKLNYYYWFLLFLILDGPSSLTLRPEGVQVCSLFLQISSNSASSSSVPSTPTESRMVKSMLALMKSVANNLPGPTRSWCMSMQWLASLQVLWPVLMCDLWFAHLDLGSLVLPTYNRPQGQEQE